MKPQKTVFIALCVLCLTAFADEKPYTVLPSIGNPAIENVISKFNNALIFHAAFDEMSNASISNGSNEPKTQKDIEYGPGKSGKALSNGTIVFPGQENLDSLSGTAILWVEVYRINPPAKNETAFFPLDIRIYDDKRKSAAMFRIGKMDSKNNAKIYSYFQGGGGGVGCTVRTVYCGNSLNWEKSKWHLLAFAWNPGCIQMSLDGQPFVKDNTIPLISGKAVQIIVAAVSPRNAQAAVSVDEVMVFNCPLSDDEINWIWNSMGKYEPLH